MKRKYDYLIVGAGLAGCVFAYKAKNSGKKVLVIEKRKHIGGNCYIEKQNGIHVHRYGAHIFRTNEKDIYNFICSFIDLNNFINTPIAISGNEVYNMPFNMNTFARVWNIRTPSEAIEMIEKTRVVTENPKNLEEHCINMVGETIYKKFIKGYTEKQWGKQCVELPKDIIKRIPIRMTYNNNYYNEKYQGVGNYNIMFEKMLEGCDVILETDYLKQKSFFDEMAEKIVYTGSVDELYDYKFGELEYRGLKFEDETYHIENKQGVAVMNYVDKNVPYTRTIEHKHFMNDSSCVTIVTKEYPEEWKVGSERYYPINNKENEIKYKKYEEMAKHDKILLCGRLAEYKYYDMQDTIKSSLCLAEREINKAG